jgi:hypothetical protein
MQRAARSRRRRLGNNRWIERQVVRSCQGEDQRFGEPANREDLLNFQARPADPLPPTTIAAGSNRCSRISRVSQLRRGRTHNDICGPQPSVSYAQTLKFLYENGKARVLCRVFLGSDFRDYLLI